VESDQFWENCDEVLSLWNTFWAQYGKSLALDVEGSSPVCQSLQNNYDSRIDALVHFGCGTPLFIDDSECAKLIDEVPIYSYIKDDPTLSALYSSISNGDTCIGEDSISKFVLHMYSPVVSLTIFRDLIDRWLESSDPSKKWASDFELGLLARSYNRGRFRFGFDQWVEMGDNATKLSKSWKTNQLERTKTWWQSLDYIADAMFIDFAEEMLAYYEYQSASRTFKCATCGQLFTTHNHRRGRKYCSGQCRARANKRKQRLKKRLPQVPR